MKIVRQTQQQSLCNLIACLLRNLVISIVYVRRYCDTQCGFAFVAKVVSRKRQCRFMQRMNNACINKSVQLEKRYIVFYCGLNNSKLGIAITTMIGSSVTSHRKKSRSLQSYSPIATPNSQFPRRTCALSIYQITYYILMNERRSVSL